MKGAIVDQKRRETVLRKGDADDECGEKKDFVDRFEMNG